MLGYSQYRSLVDINYNVVETSRSTSQPVRSVADKLLDLIFSTDSNGWPQSSLSVMLSDKTSDDVRTFIQNNLLSVGSDDHVINDEKVVSEFRNLSSEFLAKCSRNRFESVEDYENRLQEIIRDDELSAQLDSFHKKLQEVSKNV